MKLGTGGLQIASATVALTGAQASAAAGGVLGVVIMSGFGSGSGVGNGNGSGSTPQAFVGKGTRVGGGIWGGGAVVAIGLFVGGLAVLL